MNKEDFINRWCTHTETELRKVMMVDLNLVINQVLKEKEELDLINNDCE